jgi:hypothetical protein
LPFFATALGLIVASLNYSVTQLPSWRAVLTYCGRLPAIGWHVIPCAWSVLLAGFSLATVVCLSGFILFYLALATRRRGYTRVGPESMIVARTRALHAYYASKGMSGDALDTAVGNDVRAELLDPFSAAVEANRAVTLRRYHYRALAVACLLWSLLFALLGTTFVAVTAKFAIVEVTP